MYDFKKNGKVFTSKSVGTGPSSCEKNVFNGAAVSQRLTAGVLNMFVTCVKSTQCPREESMNGFTWQL